MALTARKNINALSNANLVTGNQAANGDTNEIFFGALLEWDDATDKAIPYVDGHTFCGIAAEGTTSAATYIKVYTSCEIMGLSITGTPEVGDLVYSTSDDTADLADAGTNAVGYVNSSDGSTFSVVFKPGL